MADFIEYASKKQLKAANILTGEQFNFIAAMKYVFAISLHEQKRYAALTLYNANAENKYSFLVLDLQTKSIEKAESIKLAKQDIRSRLGVEKRSQDTPPSYIPSPSCASVDMYLKRWNTTADLYEPEKVLRQLFTEAYPTNIAIDEIILKVAALNTVYNTYIYSVYPVAQHILSLGIDERLRAGDETLVNELMRVMYGEGKKTDHYSFATKYCSFHNPDAFPIYDSYVDKILQYYRDNEGFSSFQNKGLKHYPTFKQIVNEFRAYFGLEQYTVKQIDQYLWQFGKEYFK